MQVGLNADGTLKEESEEEKLARLGPYHTAAVAFVFPPVGWQHINMGRGLYEHNSLFRRHMDECDEVASPHLPQVARGMGSRSRDASA